MSLKISYTLFPWLILITCALLCLYTSILSSFSGGEDKLPPCCNSFKGRWVQDLGYSPMYGAECPFHRNTWNCLRNRRENMGLINSWRWVPENCELPRSVMRNKKIGFVGDSLNENFLVSLLSVLLVADKGARKWKRKGAWRGAFFPKFNVTVV